MDGYTVKSRILDEFHAEEFDIQEDGMIRFSLESKENKDSIIEKVRYVPITDIIAIDGFEEFVDDDDEKDEEKEFELEAGEEIQMTKE